MVGCTYIGSRYVTLSPFLDDFNANEQTWDRRWSWYAGHSKPGVFEIAWQMVSGVNRLAVALESHKVAIIDASRIPALQDPDIVVNGTTHDVS